MFTLCISKINQKHIELLMIGTTKLQIKRKSGYFWKGSSKNHSVNLSSSPNMINITLYMVDFMQNFYVFNNTINLNNI